MQCTVAGMHTALAYPFVDIPASLPLCWSPHDCPAFGLGTFRLKDQTVIDSVRNALEVGYRAIDTAQIYGNEAEVGQAIADSGVPRDDIYLTTKVWITAFKRDALLASLRTSLEKLRTEYVDLALIHWPSPNDKVDVPMEEYLAALAEAKAQGLTREIGISNFTIAQTRKAIGILGAGAIATNQIEIHPYLQNRLLVKFLQDNGIHITAYMSLAYGEVIKDPVIQAIAGRHQATAGAGRAGLGAAAGLLGHSVLDQAREPGQQPEAAAIRLTDEDMAQIAKLDRGHRLATRKASPAWD
jgi:2,5-diketo-D-gluconate reductase B